MQLRTIQDFSRAANEAFALDMGGSAMDLTLVEVKPLAPQRHPGVMREPFSLLFKSESPVILPQRSYRMRNATMGALDLFLVPVARDGKGIVYQALFN